MPTQPVSHKSLSEKVDHKFQWPKCCNILVHMCKKCCLSVHSLLIKVEKKFWKRKRKEKYACLVVSNIAHGY